MHSQIRRLALLVPTAVALSFAVAPSFAQGYPTKPIRLIVPYAAGGGTDFFARTVGRKLGEQLGQTIIVDNKPGAATIIGAEVAARSAPDGYTALVADSTTVALNPSLYKKLPYDPVEDFSPVTLTARFAMLLVVNPDLSKATTVKELIEEAKKDQGNMSYASVGAGTTHHLTMELFQQRTGIKLVLQGRGSGHPGCGRRASANDVRRSGGRRADDQGGEDESAGGCQPQANPRAAQRADTCGTRHF